MYLPHWARNLLQITLLQFFACQRECLGKKQAGHKAGEFVFRTFLMQTDPKEGAVTKPFNFSFSTTVGHHNLKYVVIVVLVVVVVIIVIVVVVVIVAVGVYGIERVDS